MTRKLIFCGLAAALGAVASAQGYVDLTPVPYPADEPMRACMLDAQGNIISDWEDTFEAGQDPREVQAWNVSYDCVHYDFALAAFNAALYNPTAPTNFRIWTASATSYVNWPLAANDVQVGAPATGRPVQRFVLSWMWNPTGVFPIAATPNATGLAPSLIFWSVSGMNTDGSLAPWATVLGGIRFDSAATLGNNFYLSTRTIAENSAISLPPGDGYIVEVRVRDAGGNFIPMPAPGNVQFGWRPQAGPDDPNFPGTNTSNSDGRVWIDLNASQSLTFGATPEIRDSLGANIDPPFGKSQPAYANAWDSNALYADFIVDRDAKSEENKLVSFKWIASDSAGTPILNGSGQPVTSNVSYVPGATGVSHMIHPRLTDGTTVQNTYMMWIKPPKCLAKLVGPFTFGTTSVDLGTLNFLSGDIDNDNEIGPGDFGALASAFLSVPGDANWNADADLDWDGEVGPGDFSFLASNFLESGDADPTG